MEFEAPQPGPAGARQQRFIARRGARRIPGLLWTPQQGQGARPLVLVQHGGSGHKGDPAVLELVEALAGKHGLAVAAIDGPIHGDRRAAPAGRDALLAEFLSLWQAGGDVEDYVADWLAVVEELRTLEEVNESRLGWCGLSMGTAYGMSVLARCEAIGAAVVGKWSARYPRSAFLADEARRVRADVLFIQHWDDELFDREGTLEVFDALGTRRKRLVAYPGGHFGRSAEELARTVEHLAAAL